MTRVAIVTVPYITAMHHAIMAFKTMISIECLDLGVHIVDRIAVSNAFEPVVDEIEVFRDFFDCWIDSDQNVLAGSWNRGIDLAFERGNDYALVINLDLSFHTQFLKNIIRAAQCHVDAVVWSGMSWPDEGTMAEAPLFGSTVEPGGYFSCFMVDQRLFREVGRFDENLKPAYHEDSDMCYRLQLAKLNQYKVQDALFYHYDRATLVGLHIENKTEELHAIRNLMNTSMEYYFRKWGGLPGHEVFLSPFNEGLV